jgi:hypothetical protein
MTEQTETAAQIHVTVASERIVVADMDVRSEFDIELIHGSGLFLPEGWALKKVEHAGSMTLNGNKLKLNSMLFYQEGDEIPDGSRVGTPKPVTVTITHMDGTVTNFFEVVVTNRGYEFSAAEASQTSYEFLAISSSDDPVEA